MTNTELLDNVVKEYKSIVEFYKQRTCKDGTPEYKELTEHINARTSEFVEYLLNSFGSKPCTTDDIRFTSKVINDRSISTDDITVELLETVAPGAVPCAMFKRLTWNERLPIIPLTMKNWRKFCEHYNSIIPLTP